MALRRRVATVAVGQQLDVVAHGLAHGGNQLLGAPGRGVAVVARGHAQAHLEGLEAARVAQLDQPRGLVFGRDVAPHAGAVDRERIGLAAEQLADRLALDLAVEVPDGRVHAGQRPADVRPGELHVGVDHAVHQGVDLRRIAAQHVPGHLPVQHRGGDVRLEGRELPVALAAVVGRDADDAVAALRPRLDLRDGQARLDDAEVGVVLGASQVGIGLRSGRFGLRGDAVRPARWNRPPGRPRSSTRRVVAIAWDFSCWVSVAEA